MASSRESTRTTERTGPKISSLATLMSSVTLSRMVGSKKKPSSNGGSRPSRATSAPLFLPQVYVGADPVAVALADQGRKLRVFLVARPHFMFSAASLTASTTVLAAAPAVAGTLPARHRSPALP